MASPRRSPVEQPPLLLDSDLGYYGKCNFRILRPIGTFSEAKLPVYKALVIHQVQRLAHEDLTVEDIFVAVKCVHGRFQRDAYANLRREGLVNATVIQHDAIMGIRRPFLHEAEYLCAVFPYMSMGSMRYIMRTKYPHGLPEDCILIILKEALEALGTIHEHNHLHRQFNAGSIFLRRKPDIKLAFSASMYTPDEDQDSHSPSSSLPMDSICTWAAAPEVYNHHPDRYTSKADVWMVGITALELLCGGLNIPDRATLESVVRYINNSQRLPKKKNAIIELIRTLEGTRRPSSTNQMVVPKKISKEFERLVVMCLEWEPIHRPPVTAILDMDVFTTLRKTVAYFYQQMRQRPVIPHQPVAHFYQHMRQQPVITRNE